jgi:hypothetical protein
VVAASHGSALATQYAEGNNIIQAINSAVVVVEGAKVRVLDIPVRPKKPQNLSPSRLIQARSTPVDYVDRSGVFTDTLEWALSGDPFAVKVIGGHGGSGKTRLGVEICRNLTDPGSRWRAGMLLDSATPASIDALAVLSVPTLVVVDYAETRTEQLGHLLVSLAISATTEAPVRVLLLVRRPAPVRPGLASGGSVWVDAVRGVAEADQILDCATELLLEDAQLDANERGLLFTSAVRAYGAGGDEVTPTDVDLGLNIFAQPLPVVMAAYLAARDPLEQVPITAEGMYDAILEHEERYWRAQWGEQPFTLTRGGFSQAVALATLTDRDPREANTLLKLLDEHEHRPVTELRQLDTWLMGLYPSPNGSPEVHSWGPLEPDLLGEHLISEHLIGQPAVIRAALDSDRHNAHLERPLIVMSRIAARSPNSATPLARIIQETFPGLVSLAVNESVDPVKYFEDTIRLPNAIRALVEALGNHLDIGILTKQADSVPFGNHVLAGLGAALNTEIVVKYRCWLRRTQRPTPPTSRPR